MPIQMPQWTEYLSCPICCNMFDEAFYRPISLACGHTICKCCLGKLKQKRCPFDQNVINRDIDELPVNLALLQLVGVAVPETQEVSADKLAHNTFYVSSKKCIEDLAIYLKPLTTGSGSMTTALLSRPMQRKLVALVNCQLVEEEGRTRAMRAARSLGERTVTELVLQHQNPQQLSANLWASVRARGCQFLGPAMQEEVLKLILLALEDGSALSRKVLVLFVVQRLEKQYPQASKTAIGHVVQLLYRASCFKVTKRDEESSLMQLKDEFRAYEALRREHDTQIVQIATEGGLRISPEQWSSLLYGDTSHKSHMQSIIDKLQTPQSFCQSVQELVIALQRSADPGNLVRLQPHLDLLSNIDPTPESPPPSWENLEAVLKAIRTVVHGLVDFIKLCTQYKVEPQQTQSTKFKTSLCRDLTQKGNCPRGTNCTFAHSPEELERYRTRHRKNVKHGSIDGNTSTYSSLTPEEQAELSAVTKSAQAKLMARSGAGMLALSTPDTVSSTNKLPSKALEEATAIHFGSSNIPVAKAMPILQKGSQMMQQMIYSSPTAGRIGPSPEVIPIAQPVLSDRGFVSSRTPGAGIHGITSVPLQAQLPRAPSPGLGGHGVQARNLAHRTMGRLQHVHVIRESPYYHAPPGDPPIPINAIQAGSMGALPKQYRRQPHGSYSYPLSMETPAYLHAEGRGAAVKEPIKTMTPPNPYTGDCYTMELDKDEYEQSLTSQHLDLLHRRKTELLHQLNKTKHVAMARRKRVTTPLSTSSRDYTEQSPLMGMSTSSVTLSHMSQGPLMSTISQSGVMPGVMLPETRESGVEHGKVSPLAMLVADSMATSHSTMTLANLGITDEPIFTGADIIAPETCTPWSSGEMVDLSQVDTSNGDYMEKIDDTDDCYDLVNIDTSQTLERDSIRDSLADDDEFIPFLEHSTVSKYGPISRMARASNTKNTAPLQVTAAQLLQREMAPVTAITPIQRPYPISVEVPTQYSVSPAGEPRGSHGHMRNPHGFSVASSLPTALMQPSLLVAGTSSSLMVSGLPEDEDAMWNLKEKMLNMPGAYKPAACSTAEREQIRHELVQLTKQIDYLEMSEHDRLARELQAVELNIQEAERQKEMEKQEQEILDHRMAQRLALEEAENSLEYIDPACQDSSLEEL